MYEEIQKDGSKVVRLNTNKKYNKEELKAQREGMEKAAKEGKVICLTDLFITHGM